MRLHKRDEQRGERLEVVYSIFMWTGENFRVLMSKMNKKLFLALSLVPQVGGRGLSYTLILALGCSDSHGNSHTFANVLINMIRRVSDSLLL